MKAILASIRLPKSLREGWRDELSGMKQGEIWWADLPPPAGSRSGFRRPVVIVQGDRFNRSRIATVVVVPLTTNLHLAEAPGNVVVPSDESGLSQDSVANVSLISAIDRTELDRQVGRVSVSSLAGIMEGIDVLLGRRDLR